ncbi:phage tail tape measure protein [Streptomyces sp. NPDC048629]|uniref:phage tail tape measure protein n=1 Tax=Streptomyces sp. NPDC048629 TaxID=3154824 RepID=UPI00341A62A9
MATRTVAVVLTASVGAFRTSMRTAARTATTTAASIRTSMTAAGRTMTRMGEQQKNSLKAVQTGSLALVAAFGFAVAASAKFEKAMSNVQAVTRASAGEMATLRAAALHAGRTTSFSAVQAADAMHELAKAGVSTADIAGGALTGALNLAAAAEVGVAEGAEIAANAMTVFGLSGKDVGHVADLLAAAANKSTTDVHDMGMSLRMAGQVASQTGLSIEDTVGALTLFAAEGLKGSDAGTSFKVMLQRLTPNSKEAKATLDALGLSAYDAQGNFVGLQEFAGRMQQAFSKLTPEARNAAMGVIFGSDAVRAANILYKYGEQGLRSYTNAVNDQGYAAAVAQTRMNNLVGDLKLLRSALETALIETGSGANAALRDMVQWLTRLLNAYNSMSPATQRMIGSLTGIVGVIGLVGASILLLLPRVMLVRRELAALGITATRTRGMLMTLGRASVIVAGLMAISYAAEQVRAAFADAPPSVAKLGSAMVDFAQKGKVSGELAAQFGDNLDKFSEAVNRVAHPDWQARATDITNSLTFDLTKGFAEAQIPLDEAREKLKSIDEALSNLVQSGAGEEASAMFGELAQRAEEGGTSTEKLLTLLPNYADALATTDTQMKLTAGSQGDLAEQTAVTADEMEDQRSAAEKLADSLKALNGAAITGAEREIAFRQSLSDLTAAVKENGHSLDVTSEKGRAVKGAFLDAAKAAMEHAEAVSEQRGSVEAGNAVLATDIALLRKQMEAAGFSKEAVDNLTSSYAQLPGAKETYISAPGATETADQLQTIKDKLATTKGKTIEVKALTQEGQRALEALGFKIERTKGKTVRITAPTGNAQSQVAALKAEIDRLRNRSITITTIHRTVKNNTLGRPQQGEGGISAHARGGLIRRYASGGSVDSYPGGGLIDGPGTGTSDSILARVSNGEYIIRAAAVARYGTAMLDRINGMTLTQGAVVSGTRYAGGSGTPQQTVAALTQALAAHGGVDVHVHFDDPTLRNLIDVQVAPQIRQSEQRQARRARVGRA